jgi:hypothetical protein
VSGGGGGSVGFLGFIGLVVRTHESDGFGEGDYFIRLLNDNVLKSYCGSGYLRCYIGGFDCT